MWTWGQYPASPPLTLTNTMTTYKLSGVIARLQTLLEEHGDLPVRVKDSSDNLEEVCGDEYDIFVNNDKDVCIIP